MHFRPSIQNFYPIVPLVKNYGEMLFYNFFFTFRRAIDYMLYQETETQGGKLILSKTSKN